jgi:5'-nucleotidase
VQPWGNRLVTVTITGVELRAVLEREQKDESVLNVSEGLTVSYARSSGQWRVTSLRLNDVRVGPEAKVRVTTNEHFAAKDPTLRDGTEKVVGPADIEALATYFARHPNVAPPKAVRSTHE